MTKPRFASLFVLFIAGCTNVDSGFSSSTYCSIPEGYSSGQVSFFASVQCHPNDAIYLEPYLYSKKELPVLMSVGREQFAVSALEPSTDIAPSYEKESFAVPDHLPPIPTPTTKTGFYQGMVSLGSVDKYEILGSTTHSRGFGGGPITTDVLVHLGPWRFDDCLHGTYPFVITNGEESNSRKPLYTLVLEGTIEMDDVASAMYGLLGAALDDGSLSSLCPNWKRENIADWEQEYLFLWNRALSDIHYADYSYRKFIPQSPYVPSLYSKKLDDNFSKQLGKAAWFDENGSELDVVFNRGYVEFLRFGKVRVFSFEDYYYREKTDDSISDMENDYGALFGHRQFFGNLPFRHIWLYHPDYGCMDISRAYDMRLLGDNHIEMISRSVYGYHLDHSENEAEMEAFYGEMVAKNLALPRKTGWTDIHDFRQYLYPEYMY